MVSRICAVAVVSLLIGCATTEPIRINSESDQTFQQSFEAMQRSLNRDERTQLSIAILRIRMTGIKSAAEAHSRIRGESIQPMDVKDQIDGLTFAEILKLAGQSGVEAEILK